MLTAHTCIADKNADAVDLSRSGLPADVVWMDILNGEPDEIAGAAVFLASAAGSFMTGQHMIIDGGVLAGSPAHSDD